MVFRPGQRAGERRAARCAARPLPARKSRGISWFHCSRFWRKFQPAEEGRRRRRRGPVFPPRLPRPASGGWPGKAGKSAALPHRAEAKPGPPHAVRIRTDTFLCPEKCPGCRVRWGWAGRSIFLKAALSFARAARGAGSFARGGRVTVRRRTRAFRTRCPRTVQRVRSEAHYAAAVPRLARPASGGGPGKAGKSAALPHRAEAKPGPPHVVRIRTDTFLCPEKCPGCRVRWGWAGRSVFLKAALSFARAAGGWGVLRVVAASPSAAARGVSDTLPSYRAACSLRGALRGGSAASGSAGIGRRAGQSGQERRPDLTGISLSRRRRGKKSASPCLRTTGRRLRGIALV